ncbi:MAG TPA: SdrD B-like domain-containing protein, partial [Chitinophagaceae bacterium]|nr:SdrD B-like domain-containing protein [Chitinophagaceae bacterium]
AVNVNNLNLDAGIVSTTVASVGDYVWYDVNQDGIQDASENGIGGVLVTLYNDAQLPVASTITLPDGSYIFTNVTPGTYTMGFSNTPEGMVFTQQVGGPFDNNNSNVDPSNGITASFVVVAGTHNPTIDAGLTTPIIAGLGNYVWHDVNINGLQDAGEPGVAGVLVTLDDASGTVVLSSNVTDGNGAYSFTHLVAGTYVVGFSNLPSGSTRTQNVGVINDPLNSDMNLGGKTEAITLSAGEFNPNIDAGIYYGIPLNAKELTATLAIIKDANTCEVNWYTVDEKNTSSFVIERSIDGAHFEKVGNVNAGVNTNGRTNYQFNDNISSISNEKVIYYKIKLIDVDHKVSYSNTINVQQGNMNQETVMIYPSPFTDIIHVDYMSADESALEMELTDLAGRTIQKKQQEVTKGINRLTIENLHALSTGNYFLKLIDINTGEVFISKIAK